MIQFSVIDAPSDLSDRVMRRIHQAEVVQFRSRMSLSVFGFALFVGMLVLGWNTVVNEWNEGWASYLQLMASDPDIIASSWQSFLTGFLEVAPVYTIVYTSGLALIASYFVSSVSKHRIHQS